MRSYLFADPSLYAFNREFIERSLQLSSLLDLRKKSSNPSEREAACLLKLHLTQMVFIDATRHDMTKGPDDLAWDNMDRLQHFRNLVDCAAEAVETSAGLAAPAYYTFSFDFGVVTPMFFVASRCRDPFVRRKAIQVLKDAKCQNTVWNSGLTAQALERVVKIEENGIEEVRCAGDIPRSNRILEMKLDLYKGSKSGKVGFKVGETWLYEELSWE